MLLRHKSQELMSSRSTNRGIRCVSQAQRKKLDVRLDHMSEDLMCTWTQLEELEVHKEHMSWRLMCF